MARKPDERYPSAAAFDAALGRTSLTTWRKVAPHAVHSGCWASHQLTGEGQEVCVISAGKRFSVQVRRVPSGYRVRRHCHADIPERLLPGKLRRIFEDLA